jgi:NADH:ubiquinone oxidoreductase subunit C
MLIKYNLIKYNSLENLNANSLSLLLKTFENLINLYHYVNLVLGKLVLGILLNIYEISLFVEKNKINKLIYLLKNHISFIYYLVDIIIIDRPAHKQRFEIVYLLTSYITGVRLYIHVYVNEFEFVPTVSDIYLSANWMERECWDLFGVVFKGNPDLRRLLTDYGFSGFPMRKDFPLTGHFELFYSDLLQRIKRTRVLLMQEYRYYDFLKIW